MLDDVGGRKFMLSLLVVLLSTILVWFMKISEEVFQYTVLVTTTTYVTGNVVQKLIERKEGKNGSTS